MDWIQSFISSLAVGNCNNMSEINFFLLRQKAEAISGLFSLYENVQFL